MKTLKELEEEYTKPEDPNVIMDGWQKYVKVNVACSKCGKSLYKNENIVLTTYPPMYSYKCFACGNIECSCISAPSAWGNI